MGLKLFGPGGIDQKSNDLLRDPRSLRDSLNIRYSIIKEYEKRPGTSVDTDFSGDTYHDVIFIKSLGEYFFRNGGNYYSYKNGVKKTIPLPYIDPTSSPNSDISGAEYLNTFIFTHVDGQAGTFKYDGNCIYMAGLPVPIFTPTQTSTAVTGFMLSFYDFIDGKGNQIFGPSQITAITNQNLSYIVPTFKNTGFYQGYLVSTNNIFELKGNGTVADRTITYSSKSSDLIIGSNVVFRRSLSPNIDIQNADGTIPYGPYSYVSLEIESFTGSTIVFTAASFKGRKVGFTGVAGLNVHGAVALRTYFSTSETTGYTNGYVHTIDNTLTTNTFSGAFNLTGNFLLSDVYDITTSKLRPPKCKYICTYGSQIAYGNVSSFWDFENKETTYTNNDLVMYSDISTGDLGENVSEDNRQLIGDTYDGQITGLIRAKDSLIILKDSSPYAMDGILSPGLYSLRKIETNSIGGLSNKSLLVIEDAIIFQGIDGLYAISGNSAKKISGKLDPFFAQSDFDPSKTRALMDVLNESYLFYTNKGVVVFNFEFKEWFVWDLINATNGLTLDNDQNIKMFSGSTVKKFITAKNDSGTAINAWIKTAWLDFGEPSLLKKIVDVRYFSLHNVGQTLTSRLYRDWDESKVKADFTIDMSSSSTKTVLRKLDIQQAQSVSLFIGNNVVNEDLNLSGFEINGALIQDRDNNVK